jgi:anti-sigma B factor antagonist
VHRYGRTIPSGRFTVCNIFELRVGQAVDGQVRLEVEGEIDRAVAPQLLDSVLCAGLAFDHHNIVVDLTDVTFMDSAGLAALAEANRRLRDQCSHLVVANPSRQITRILELVGLDDQLDIRPSLAPAHRPDSAAS